MDKLRLKDDIVTYNSRITLFSYMLLVLISFILIMSKSAFAGLPIPIPTSTPIPIPLPVFTPTPIPIPTMTPAPTPTPTMTPTPTPTVTPTPTPNICNPEFNDIFQGNTEFIREEGTTFPDNELLDDPTTLDVTEVTESSLSGTINAAWLPDVAITTVECSGNFAENFSGLFEGACPGEITGTIILDRDEVLLMGNGDDCKNSPYTFSGVLIREGTQGNVGRDFGVGSASSGCSIGRTAVGTTLTPMLILLLIPLLISIRRGISKLNNSSVKFIDYFQNNGKKYRDVARKSKRYIPFLIVPAILAALLFITVTPANAQKLIKQCPNTPNVAQFEVVCSELFEKQNNLTPSQQNLFDICDRLFATPDNDQSACDEIFDLTQGTEIAAIYTTTLRAQSSNQITKIRTRISDVRSGVASSININGITMNVERRNKAKAPAQKDLVLNLTNQDSEGLVVADVIPFAITTQAPDQGSGIGSKLGFLLNSSFNFGDRDTTSFASNGVRMTEPGFDFDIFQITAGVDYLFTDYLLFGLAFNYYYTDIDLEMSLGDISSNTFSGSIYSSFFWEEFYVNGIFTLGGANYDINRNTGQGQRAHGDTDGLYYAFAFDAGYNFQIGPFGLGPYGRFTYNQANFGSYTESVSGNAGTALRIESQKAKSLTTALGGQASYAWSTSIGVFLPQFLFEWVHEYKDDPVTTRASFAATSDLQDNPVFTVRSDEPDRNTFNIGGGISAVFARGISAFVYYEAALGWDDVSSHYIGGGIRFEL